MKTGPRPTPLIDGLPEALPFVAPERLARLSGRPMELRLGANESPFGAAPTALEAMRSAALESHCYGDPEGFELRSALSLRLGHPVESILLGAGIDEVLSMTLRAYAGPGDLVVASRGTYPMIGHAVRGAGARLGEVDYRADAVDVQGLLDAARAGRARIVYMANPDNPSGSIVPAADVERLRRELPSETLLILDEAYAEYADCDLAGPGLTETATLRLRTFSKVHGLAGMRVGHALASPRLLAPIEKIRLQFGVGRVAQRAAVAALADRLHENRVIDETRRGRKDYAALGERLGLPTLVSHTNFVCFDAGTASRSHALLDALISRGVFVRRPWGAPLDRCVRVTVGDPEMRRIFGDRLEAAWREVAALEAGR